jgi:hypothetical protein
MQIHIIWTELATFEETIELDEQQVTEMKDDNIDFEVAGEVFEYLHDNGDLDGFDAQEYDAPNLRTLKIRT